MQVWSILTQVTDKPLLTGSERLWNFRMSPCHVVSLPHVGIGFGCIPWNAISNVELRRSYTVLESGLLLLSATTISNICWRQSSLTVDAIMKQLPSQNQVSLTLDRWILTNKLAIMTVIINNLVQNWALQKVPLAFGEIDRLFISSFESFSRRIGQGPTYQSKACCTCEGRSWLFWACWRLFASNYDWWCIFKLLSDLGAAINPSGLRNRVACIEEPHTMHGAHHTACFSCIHE